MISTLKLTSILFCLLLTFFSNTTFPVASLPIKNSNSAVSVYAVLQTNHYDLPQLQSFTQALNGYNKLKAKGLIQKDILTLIDFSLSSNVKRLWVIDLASKTILYQSLVAHRRNTGEEFANNFSNAAQSFKSSVSFYVTGEVYNGKHGLSLRLDGLEKGVNDNARKRGVVMHAADYVSNSFVKNNKRLGRSQGCPAVPVGLSKEIISTIKDKSCLFIYHPKLNSQLAS
ncbi:murein L,D-transpeptidase catalytic domain family protein [Flavobacterium sp.]|uniref:murein L,D-transpeptidase catalytic domain family protein n=1 Tax=Flavobacterium sp. TaxID=239 RepID=UPI001B799A18|nr:murein L,D-transpeptidase catalytic domain family protein [Flavobacterium sp.]MBP6183211.1 murein L,D-transpeptidase catalytic domain family protein [Flavobacterium sp.]